MVVDMRNNRIDSPLHLLPSSLLELMLQNAKDSQSDEYQYHNGLIIKAHKSDKYCNILLISYKITNVESFR